mmetsp:Transcript_4732/g.8129  ORF Transcript_4732/g.8129 Transcript_4732/m.8129 type:complete len:144 (+) Transcript_4732:3-434(+)
MMEKIVKASLRLRVPAGKANPSPPVGPVLGQQGLNIMEFCKDFNARTKGLKDGTIVPVKLTVYTDKTFTFVARSPATSELLKKAAGVKDGAKTPGTQKVGEISQQDLEEIAKTKQIDIPDVPLESVIKSVLGTAKSMGIGLKS